MELNKKLNFWGKNMSKTFTKTYKVATEKSGKLIEEAKLRMQIAGENDKISEELEKIGELVYEDFKSGNSTYADFEDICKGIEKSELSISNMKSKILEMKKMKLCHVCEASLSKDDRYCSKCGAEQEEVEEEVDTEKKTDTCPYCNAKLDSDAVFCSACGTKLDV